MKKFVCIGILALITVFITVPAYANTISSGTYGVITPQYTYISLLNAGLNISSSGKAACTGLASAYSNSQTTRLTVQLQKSHPAAGARLSRGQHRQPEFLSLPWNKVITLLKEHIEYVLQLTFIILPEIC